MSDDQQRKASIEDQIRNCHDAAEEEGWHIAKEHIYVDEGKTGTTMFDRPGFAALRAAYRQPNSRPTGKVLEAFSASFGASMHRAGRDGSVK